MIKLESNKQTVYKPGEIYHFRVKAITMTSPGRWRLEVEDITPLPGYEPAGYLCRLCGVVETVSEDGQLPPGWQLKQFPDKMFFICRDCINADAPYCRVCGCTQDDPCQDGGEPCHWEEPGLCSRCATMPKK